MLTINKNIIVQGRHQKPILTDVFYNNDTLPKPVVIFCHGYKGFKDWGAWDLVATAFANAGFFFIKFNFSHNGGTIDQPVDFSDLEAFANNNYIKELDDLESVIDWVFEKDFKYKEQIINAKISLIGHSRGGGIVTIKAAEDPRVSNVITWAGVSDYKARFPKGEAFEEWKKTKVMYVENGRTKQRMPHYYQFYTSFIEAEERLTIARAVENIKIPHLIIHGTEDPTVAVEEGKIINTWNPNSELFLIQGADHVLGAKHPWQKDNLPQYLEKATQKSIEFAGL